MVEYAEVLEWFKSGEAEAEELIEIRDAINEVVPVTVEHEPMYWETKEATVFKLGDESFDLAKRGRAQLKQLDGFRSWLKTYAKPMIENIYPEGKGDDDVSASQVVDVLLELLDSEALIALGVVVLGADEEFVAENFDLGWVLAGASVILKSQPAIRRLASGFFGKRG